MVPSDAATAIADVIGEAILLARAGETFVLGSTPIWVTRQENHHGRHFETRSE